MVSSIGSVSGLMSALFTPATTAVATQPFTLQTGVSQTQTAAMTGNPITSQPYYDNRYLVFQNAASCEANGQLGGTTNPENGLLTDSKTAQGNGQRDLQALPVSGSASATSAYSKSELKELMSILQKADMNKDGIVTKDELENYKKALMQQREQLLKMKVDKLVMDALSGSGASSTKDGKLTEINNELGKVNDLLKTDSSGTSNFDQLAASLGNSGGISLSSLGGAISA